MDPMFPLSITPARKGSGERARSLLSQLVAAIRDGRLHAGLKLPASRDLARITGASRNTVVSVYEALTAQGLTVTRRGAGTFVASTIRIRSHERSALATGRLDPRINPIYHKRHVEPRPVAPDGAFDFRVGLPDWHSFPWDVWRRLTARALRSPHLGSTAYIGAAGPRPLREAIAVQVSSTRAISCSADDIVITAGAQQAFDLLARLLVMRPGASVAVEDPGYDGSRDAFVVAGAGIVPIDVDEDGMRVDTIPSHVRVVSVTPSHQYPLGSQLSEQRRKELLAFAAKHDAVIVEDDYDGEFRFDGRSFDALKTLDRGDRVFYVGTFSKTLFPALRLGYVISPPWAREALVYTKQCADLHSATLSQSVLAAFITEGHMGRHLASMRKLYQERCHRLLAALTQHCEGIIEPFARSAGLHIIASLPEGIDPDALILRCREGGVMLSSLGKCWVDHPRWPMIGLGFGAARHDQIDAGIAKLRALAFPLSLWTDCDEGSDASLSRRRRRLGGMTAITMRLRVRPRDDAKRRSPNRHPGPRVVVLNNQIETGPEALADLLPGAL